MSLGAPELQADASAEDIAVAIEGLSKKFAVRRSWKDTIIHPFQSKYATVLSNVSLDVRRGEFFGLLGPNGAGKTTLFKILSGLILMDEGRATVCGFDVSSELVDVRRRLRPVVSDERSLNWRLSARENLRLYASLQDLRGQARDRRVGEVLEIVDLTDTGDKMVAKFSSGMRQRLMIARALLAEPDVLLLDEPTRSLDPVSARRFRTFLREELVDRQGCTVLLATHNAEEALELCDRVGVLNRGQLLRTGSPDRLMSELHDHQYRLLVYSGDWAPFTAIARGELSLEVTQSSEEAGGWLSVLVNLPGGTSQAADLLQRVVSAGVSVAGLEPVRLSLAGLIERIVAGGSTADTTHA
jgi:ABC-2 type transport system ATP-binding protein